MTWDRYLNIHVGPSTERSLESPSSFRASSTNRVVSEVSPFTFVGVVLLLSSWAPQRIALRGCTFTIREGWWI
ncbi:hypothetical protein GALMADRAFT_252264 [Galerina marginata CBS 339.88]|uniref:Uncharacterized protein n=1 Tax=Galerina marginata (strain CBS 339.88) TaxID=685588 RepID=A0A067T1N6_GALM3|nr:hypothetical protein GALMADRAFT_252264 [Galerina marginata CBS 339.88]